MISRLLSLRTHVEEVLQELKWDGLPMSEWKVLENYRDLLEPLYKYTSLAGAEESTTLSMVVPVVMELMYHLNEFKERPGVRQIANLLHQELGTRFEKVLQPGCPVFCPLYIQATLLDPQYRILLSEEQVQAAKLHVLRDFSQIDCDALKQLPITQQDKEPCLKNLNIFQALYQKNEGTDPHTRNT